ncbi:MAG: SAM-dependent methyltransferase [Flavobacteriales bacterium]|jgi:predicted O-methyltransferase YrrM|nr:SAM-dependent methyltransferase [Flavobacteriales bacterium]MBT5089712.1 SAM-dependent methyltransferase [Flavobacteriales bacterium]MBT5750683.1 SAM-dependent methyltransferase [Flavobacteriales bacterium]
MKALQLIFRYIKYLFRAKSKHAAQAPFLYKLITQVIDKRTNDNSCKNIEALRKELCKQERIIKITDFGAGSTINNSKTRKVKDVAKNSAKNAKFGKLLYRIIQFYKPKNILELGTSLGISTSYLAKADANSQVFTFEGCPETAKIAQENFDNQNIKNISITLGDFNLTLTEKLKEIKTIDLAFIDGNHQEKPTIAYFKKCLEYANNNTIFVFDDIHWSDGMESAWNYIKTHPSTTLAIDLFFVGIVFIKSELSKEDFTIRF